MALSSVATCRATAANSARVVARRCAQAGTSQRPSPLVSYRDSRISARAFSRSPWPPGVAYGS